MSRPLAGFHIPADHAGRVRLAQMVAIATTRHAESLLRNRDVHPKTTSAALWRAYGSSLRKNTELAIVIDHTVSLITEARRHGRERRFAMANLFYATYIEHCLNDMLSTVAKWRKMKSADIRNMLRVTNIEAKATWLLAVFGAKPIPESQLQTIRLILEARNAFVHYKWTPETQPRSGEVMETRNLKRAERAIRYLNRRATRLVFGSSKRRLVPNVKAFARLALAHIEREFDLRALESPRMP